MSARLDYPLEPTVAPEFAGEARVAHDRYLRDSHITAPIMRKIIRDAEIASNAHAMTVRVSRALERRWRAIGKGPGCLSQSIQRTPGTLRIDDTRVTGTLLRNPHGWGHDRPEPGIGIFQNSVFITSDCVLKSGPMLVGISQHALGRWFARRMGDGSHATLHRVLGALAAACPDIIKAACAAEKPDFHFETESGGDWRGFVHTNGTGQFYCNVRTFRYD